MPRPSFVFSIAIGLVILLLASPGRAAAQSSDAAPTSETTPVAANRVKEVRIGFAGKYKSGFWAPVWLTLADADGGANDVALTGSDGDNVPVIYPADTQSNASPSNSQPRKQPQYLRVGPQRGRLGFQLRSADGQIVAAESLRDLVPPPLAATQDLLLTIGPELGVEAGIKLSRRPEERSAVAARVDSLDALPDHWWGYEGVDWIFLSTRDPRIADEMSPAQFEALRQWVLMGGRLALCIGSRGEKLLAEDSRWATFAPGRLQEVTSLRDRSGLESFTNVELPWDSEAFQRARPQVAQLVDVQGKIEVNQGGVSNMPPLAVRRTYGFGHVLFLTIDLDDPQLAAWSGRPRFVHNLLQRWEGSSGDDTGRGRQSVQHLGFDDLAGQLRAALEQFPGVTVVNFTMVAMLTLAYLVLIGPADYLLVRRAGLPSYITWVTFPLVVIGFAVAAWFMSGSAHGNVVRLNEAEVVDIDTVQQVVRGTTWHHVFSPSATQFDLDLKIDAPRVNATAPADGWLAWQGLPGTGLGGLASQQSALIDSPAYVVRPAGEAPGVAGLPVSVASSKALAGRWWSKSELEPFANLSTNGFGLPQGEIRNPFDFELEECLLAYDEWLYRLRDIPPGGRVRIEDFSPLNLEARLTQRTVVDAKDLTTPWDQSSVEVPRIMQMIMFHETVRGRGYTGLTHEYLGYLDLSEHIRSGRAILVGRASTPISRLEQDGQPVAADDVTQRWTWVRFVLPVNRSGSSRP